MKLTTVLFDLDGTLLNSNEKISPENWAAIARLREMGVHFVPASGRAFYEMPVELRESDLIRYYITSDGTMIYDKQTDTTWELPMEKELGHWVLDRLYEYPMGMMLHADTNSYVDKTLCQKAVCESYNMPESWFSLICRDNVSVPDMREFAYSLEHIQMICAFFQQKEDLAACMEKLRSHPELLVAQSDPYNLEVFAQKAGKGNALMLLAEKLGISPEATIAMGDSTNDMTMVRAAGLGLAMENGVPLLKQAANKVICNNDQHCADYVLHHYF